MDAQTDGLLLPHEFSSKLQVCLFLCQTRFSGMHTDLAEAGLFLS